MKYYAILKLDGESGTRDILNISTDRNAAIHEFGELISKHHSVSPLLEEGVNYALYDDGTEFWMLRGNGAETAYNIVYPVFGETTEGFVLDYIAKSSATAQKHLKEIKKSYKRNGVDVFKEYDDEVIFNNDDYFKYQAIKLTKGEKK